MIDPLLLVTLPLIASATLAGWLAVYTWRRRSVLSARLFAFFMVSVMAWSLTSAATHLSPTLSAKLLWTNSQYVWVGLVPALWLLFAIAYSGRERLLTLRTIALLSIHPILLQPVVWLNPGGLFKTQFWLQTAGRILTLGSTSGPLFWLHAAYSYVVLIVGSALLLRSHYGTPRIYVRQGVALAIAIAIPWIANIVTIAGAPALSHLDITPFAFAISGAALALSLFRHGFLDLVPVARSAVVRSLSTGVVVLDAQSRVIDLNPAAESILGVTREEVAGQPLGAVFPQYSYLLSRHDDLEDARDEVIVGDKRRVYDLRISALRDRQDTVIGHLLSLQDITERKESQTALSRYAERLRILHQIDQAILNAQSPEEIAVAALGEVVLLFPAQRLSVVALDEAGPARLLAIRATAKLRSATTVWQDVAATNRAVFSQVTCINDVAAPKQDAAEGADWPLERLKSEGVCSLLVVPLIVQQQRIGVLTIESTTTGAFGAEHIDMASQVATSLAVGLESARRYIAAQQELVERKLAEDALRQSEVSLRQKAEDLAARNAELDAFAHTVAHDLKTPLSLLTGYTSYMAAGEVANDSAQMDWCVRAIGQSARKMHNIIDELLLLASVRKVDEVAVQPLDMGEIVSEVLIRLSDLIAQESAEVVMPDAWPIAWGYAQWIEEVWANYISNALKYGGTPPRIELGATLLEADPASDQPALIRFWVRDNGDGLTDDQQGRLFVPFERLDQARAKGYGLGLSIVHRIMEKLGGSAGVESPAVAGQGSTFYFVLPEADIPA